MKIKEKVLNYIEKVDNNTPIFIEDIKKEMIKMEKNNNAEQIKNNINVIVYRLVKENVLMVKQRGVYYKPTKTLFGNSILGNKELVERKFLKDENGEIKGYIVGPKLYNSLGLTTLVPNITDIVTNECKYNKKYYKELRVNVYPSKIKITTENYKYLQLINLIENKENIKINDKQLYNVIFEIIDKNNLSFENLIKYARILNKKKVISNLVEIAR